MFIDFFYALRRNKVPVVTQDWMALVRALELGLHDSSLDGFYALARAVCVKDLAHYDGFDAAFLETFRGVAAQALQISEEMARWLADPKLFEGLTDEQRAMLKQLTPDELMELYKKRLAEQKERHDGGNRWIGTGGSSALGSGGTNPSGVRIGGGGGRSAMQVAEERRFREYRSDVVLDVRRIDVALRLLRDLGRDGAPDELDLEDTIDKTARNAGDLEVVMRAPKRNRAKVVLLMDVGGSMDPHAHLVERLFTAASRAGRFARFRSFYFHNCVYESIYEDARFFKPQPVADLLSSTDHDEKLVIVGDAAMHPGELMETGGSIYFYTRNPTPGIEWMRRLSERFKRSAWLNPEPETMWSITTIKILRGIFPMFPLTIEGLEGAVKCLVRGAPQGDWLRDLVRPVV